MQAMITCLAIILLTAMISCCLALSPILYGSTTAIANMKDGGGSAPRTTSASIQTNSIHDRRQRQPPRRRSSRRSPMQPPASVELFMTGGAGASLSSPDPEGPQRQRGARTERVWADYIVPDLEVPTATDREPTALAGATPRPKIVVFGASGRIGRRVVRGLLASGADLDVVAFVRDAQKLDRVLRDEEHAVAIDSTGSGDGGNGGGPRLRVVVGDVVSRRDLRRGSKCRDDDDSDDSADSADSANSADSAEAMRNDADVPESGGEEALRDAVAGSTVLVSCLATYRPSNMWTDYLRVPVVRVFRRDASRWSSDPTHPYYVNYLSTKKILDQAEKEQRRKDDALEQLEEKRRLEESEEQSSRKGRGGNQEEEGFESEIAAGLRKKRCDSLDQLHDGRSNTYHGEGDDDDDRVQLPKSGKLVSSSDRIKFIRISHLMVGHNPFRIWNIITNIFWSQLSRFDLMGEMLMEESKLVDTIVLRAGDCTDDERNSNQTSLQLCIDGRVEYPSLIGREDIADLAIVSALTKTCLNETKESSIGDTTSSSSSSSSAAAAAAAAVSVGPRDNYQSSSSSTNAHHYSWAVRWTGQHLSPSQGLRPDGLCSAALCFTKAIKDQIKVDKQKRWKEKRIKSYHGGRELIRLKRAWSLTMKPFIQSVAISVPFYATVGLLSWYLFGQALVNAYLSAKRRNTLPLILQQIKFCLPKLRAFLGSRVSGN